MAETSKFIFSGSVICLFANSGTYAANLVVLFQKEVIKKLLTATDVQFAISDVIAMLGFQNKLKDCRLVVSLL